MSQPSSYEAVRSLAAKALCEGGTRIKQSVVTWSIHGRCESPVTVELFARPQQYTVEKGLDAFRRDAPVFSKRGGYENPLPVRGFYSAKGEAFPLTVELEVPCRRCQQCLQRRAREWAQKARTEVLRSARTWFCTFTLSPDEHFAALCRAQLSLSRGGTPIASLTEEEIFRARCDAIGPELTRFVKRVRKNSGAQIRYLIVAERHAGGGELHGLPHFHALFHEVNAATPLRKRHLKDAWRCGFSDARLLKDPAAVWYVCKYLSKDMATRVRGSLHYGKTEITASADSEVRNERNVKHMTPFAINGE